MKKLKDIVLTTLFFAWIGGGLFVDPRIMFVPVLGLLMTAIALTVLKVVFGLLAVITGQLDVEDLEECY